MLRVKNKIFYLAGAVGGLCLLIISGWAFPAAADEPLLGYVPDQLVVKLVPGVNIADIHADYGTATVRPLLYSAGIYLVTVPAGSDAGTLQPILEADSRIIYAEFNFYSSAPEANAIDIYGWPDGTTTDDSGGSSTTQTTSLRTVYEWQLAGADQAHYQQQPALIFVNWSADETVAQGSGVIVAVLDTGMDLTHPLLLPHLTADRYDFVDDDASPDESFNGIDDDGDGFIDEVAGHGTHVAGIIHLVAPAAQIMPLRVLDSDGQGNSFILAEALMYAVNHGAQVINLSLGSTVQTAFMADVLSAVADQNVAIVASAGNLSANVAQYPAASSCVLSVTAVGPGMRKSPYASYGAWVDVAAPGERIFSTYPYSDFAWWKGTSMATPFVSGQAALLRGLAPGLSLSDMGDLIMGTTDDIDSTNGDYEGLLGTGLINIEASIDALLNGTTTGGGSLAGCGG